MSTIIIGMANATSHYNASYKLARQLQSRGHRIIYVGIESLREKEVLDQGFEFIRIFPEVFPDSLERLKKQNGFINLIRTYVRAIKVFRKYERALLDGKYIGQLMKEVKPDMFLLDSFNIFFRIIFHPYKVPVLALQTQLSCCKDPGIPPLTSAIIPDGSYLSMLRSEISWQHLFVRKKIKNIFHAMLGMDRNGLMKKLSARYGFPFKEEVDYKRTFHCGFKSVPDLILTPGEFDFPRPVRKNQIYINSVSLGRQENPFDWQILKKPSPLIYCSLGTLAVTAYGLRGSIRFFERLIGIFRNKPDYNLILSVGLDIDPAIFDNVPDNVYIFRRVPQIEILKRTSLMIGHAGLQSINECILSGVPMLVFPFGSSGDQNGGAARVVYHKLGLRSHIQRESARRISEKIDLIMTDPEFKENMMRMKEKYLQYEHSEEGVEVVESYLQPAPVFSY